MRPSYRALNTAFEPRTRSPELLNIVHLATHDTHGGAAVAALRLVEAQRTCGGHEATMLVREKETTRRDVVQINGPSAKHYSDETLHALYWNLLERNRTPKAGVLFSSDLPNYPVENHPLVIKADVLHLHWVTGFVSAHQLHRLHQLGKPIVWTLHDQFPFTGGCHYAGTCQKFATGCEGCPQLTNPVKPVAAWTLQQKIRFIDPAGLRLVSPSKWLRDCARKSKLFANARIDVVPYGIDVAARRVLSRNQARELLGLPHGGVVLFACSLDNAETRKGGRELGKALQILGKTSRIRDMVRRNKLTLLLAGRGDAPEQTGGLRIHNLGSLDPDDSRLLAAYRAANIFALPSLEDNLPNTLLEAMAAGCTTVAFRTGGIPDLIANNRNGKIVSRGNADKFAEALIELILDSTNREKLGDAAAETARERLDSKIQVLSYDKIYGDLLTERRRPKRPPRRSNDTPVLGRIFDHKKVITKAIEALADANQSLQQVVSSRGGEVAALHAQHELDIAEIEFLRNTLGVAMTRDRGRIRVGIWGAGASGYQVWKACAASGLASVEWFADNNPDVQGTKLGGVTVISPQSAKPRSVEYVIVGSMHREPIAKQLRELRFLKRQILTPDVLAGFESLQTEIRRLLGGKNQ